MSLEEILQYLSRFGKPKLGTYARPGWHCSVDLFVPNGVAFEVKSEFGHPTPTEAAMLCKDRLDAVLAELSAAQPTLAG